MEIAAPDGSPPEAARLDTSGLRREYDAQTLDVTDLAPSWWEQFGVWFADARPLPEPNAMALATVDPSGRPRARTVLLKSVDVSGFVWATNYRSRKGRDLAANPEAAIVFAWHELQRQVHAEGVAERLDAAASDAIWATRPRLSQLGALASSQSEVVDSRATLDDRLARLEIEFGDGSGAPVPRPEHWGGYRLRPRSVEFWQGGRNRLHDRLRFRCVGTPGEPDGWLVERLQP
ncbi:MAG: pyridoxamine 5-phosphate oxidase [Frankiaceae bacterium]|nr:pyridoxamine 5-phosphate oxidase [Frankiaceae bacterium]